MIKDVIVNRVANSGLLNIDLSNYRPKSEILDGETFNFSILTKILFKLFDFSLNILVLSFETIPILIPLLVNLRSALSDLNVSLYSALDVNIL